MSPSDHDGESQQRENCDMRENNHAPRRQGRAKRRDEHMTIEPEKTLDPIAVELAGTRLLLRALISYLLVDDPDEADHAVDALVAKVDRMSKSALAGGEPLAGAEDAVRDSAVSLIADLRKTRGAVQ
jgi:hypothetical protein